MDQYDRLHRKALHCRIIRRLRIRQREARIDFQRLLVAVPGIGLDQRIINGFFLQPRQQEMPQRIQFLLIACAFLVQVSDLPAQGTQVILAHGGIVPIRFCLSHRCFLLIVLWIPEGILSSPAK